MENISIATKNLFVRSYKEHLPVFFQSGASVPLKHALEDRCIEATYCFLPIEKTSIKGVKELIGTEHNVIPDRIEAATYMVAAAMTKGDITIENVIMDHLKPVTAKLIEAGCEIIEMENAVRVIGPEVLKPIDIKTLPHPGFPTDVQAQFMAMLTVANGSGTVIETVFENRFMHVAEFNRMGADIKIEGRSAIVKGVNQLYGAKVNATDLRAGAALILCGLIAEGETQIGEIYHIQRGYVDIDKKITALGGNIQIIED